MTVTVLDRALVAGEAGQVTGRPQDRPDPEVPEKARRRTFTAQYKLDVVAEYDAAGEGGHVTYLGPEESPLGHKETVKDTAGVLGRMFDGIEYRGSAQSAVETLAEFAGVPVWNGLTDEWHPTQMLADIPTMRDHTDKSPATWPPGPGRE